MKNDKDESKVTLANIDERLSELISSVDELIERTDRIGEEIQELRRQYGDLIESAR